MSAPNPRKFSEKIAILERKRLEDENAFKNIMEEVRDITRVPAYESVVPSTSQGLGPPNSPWSRGGGSLPNVHEITHPIQSGMDFSIVGPWMGPGWIPGTMPEHSSRVMHRGRSPGTHPHGHYHPYSRGNSPQQVQQRQNSPGSVSPHRHSSQERPGMSPTGIAHVLYPSPVGLQHPQHFLQPPTDPGWRRTHSDPGLHSSVMQPPSLPGSSGGPSPGSQPHTPPTHTPPQTHTPPHGVHCDSSQGASPFYLDPKTGLEINRTNDTASSGSLPDIPSISHNPLQGYVQNQQYSDAHMQQRHSIQFPVHHQPMSGVYDARCNNALATTPPYSGPESQSEPNSPANQTGDSPVASPNNQGYTQLQAQMQNFSMSSNSQGIQDFFQQQQLYFQQQQQQDQYASNLNSQNKSTLSPKGNQVPEIHITGADGMMSANNSQFDQVPLDFSDIQIRYDDMQLLLNDSPQVDADSEDALRRDS